ncbi:MAG: DUF911 domain-containing protein [Chloroflexi bacterium]|nr:DUF911 domain-containing protein [Chloroflexota bacterium]
MPAGMEGQLIPPPSPLPPIPCSLVLTVSDVKQFAYCPRVVYFTYALPRRRPTTYKMKEGKIEHEHVAELEERRSLRAYGLAEEIESELDQKVNRLWEFEQRRILVRVQEILTRQPHIGVDSLAALALPMTVEQRLDGKFLGLSSHLSADAFVFSEPMMVDIKFGKPQKFHRL